MINISELTLGQLKEIQSLLLGGSGTKEASPLPFGVGDKILVRTVTMIQLGRVRAITPEFFVLDDGGWVADTARFSETLVNGTLNEFEKAPSWLMVSRGAIVDVYPWLVELPTSTK